MGLAAVDRRSVATAPARAVAWLASLWWTLAWMALTAAILIHGQIAEEWSAVWLSVPFGGLFVNLLAALVVHERLRRQPGLLVFHLGLAAVALTAAGGRLTALTGSVEVTQGTLIEPALVDAKPAPLHPWRLDQVAFIQGAFRIDYDPNMQRRHTHSSVHVPGAGGRWETVEIGDDRPLKMFGYRFYTTPNKGFAVVLRHTDASGAGVTGAVHLPSYPLNEHNQSNTWQMPNGGPKLELWLHMPKPVHVEDAAWSFGLPEDAVLVVGVEGERHELKPGQELRIGRERVRYEDLRLWMGYQVFFDPSLPWLAAAALVACAGLAWHSVGKVRAISGDCDA